MKALLTLILMTIAAPAAVQADPGHAHQPAAPAATTGKAQAKARPGACHMMNGKMMEMRGAKMVPCSKKPAKAPAARDQHSGHTAGH